MFSKSLKTAAVFSALVVAAILPVKAADFPTRGIEFVAGYGPGGGHDTMLRSMAKIIRETKLVDASINVVNKPGGGGATSLGYLSSHAGDGHYLMAATSSFITTPLTADVGLSYKDFTPIARLGIDPTLLVVPSSSPIKSLDDIKNAGRVLNVAGGGRGQIEHIATIMVSEAMGVKLNFIPFQGDGEVASALLGGQVDFAMINPGAVSEFIKSGRMTAIAISTEERAEMFPDVPTFKEKGYDVVASVFRGVVAAKDIPAEAKAYLTDLVERLQATPEWKTQYLQPNGIIAGYLDADAFAAYLEQTNNIYQTNLSNLGLLKKN
ncbi:tripartite tricarboxylate transporter substrate binding protein [Cohaesibacter haloalkalitolerans]|uniref:tripartite tricarboxylate transporter substrate binding protein n=1 Tax=Cohaesibacter haloalkalitolerans TaxID=1162980 RepID=UPI000E6542EA|nr:tripartite tricarboxylate transporter substrate binding protein [Cohaesibacter haloalkalitolerans]